MRKLVIAAVIAVGVVAAVILAKRTTPKPQSKPTSGTVTNLQRAVDTGTVVANPAVLLPPTTIPPAPQLQPLLTPSAPSVAYYIATNPTIGASAQAAMDQISSLTTQIDNTAQSGQFTSGYQQTQQQLGDAERNINDLVGSVLGPLQDAGASVEEQQAALTAAGITPAMVQQTGQIWPQLTG